MVAVFDKIDLWDVKNAHNGVFEFNERYLQHDLVVLLVLELDLQHAIRASW